MLTELHIENIAVIDQLDVEFQRGFTVLTGETGAGKSIIIDSILLLLGSKASKDLIRSGKEAGVVSACFSEVGPEALCLLADNALDLDEDGNITILRKIGADGRNSARINGINVTVSTLRELGQLLVNVHGQHDGVLLLDSSRHQSFLDAFGSINCTAYQQEYQTVRRIREQIGALQRAEAEKEQRRVWLTEALKQLSDCGLREGEHEELLQKRKNLLLHKTIAEALNTAVVALYDGELAAAPLAKEALDSLSAVQEQLPEGKELTQRLSQIFLELNDLGAELGSLFSEYAEEDLDPDQIEERLDRLEQMKRLFGPTDQEVLRNREMFQEELSQLDHTAEELEKMESDFQIARVHLEEQAGDLSAKRRKAAQNMEKKLQEELRYLDMPKVCFLVKMQDRVNERGGIRYRADGKDEIEFYLSANAGQEPRPLAKIASGGELSRIMLSFKSVLNESFDTVIYDEVDTGVSGATAEKIGKKLKSSAAGKQVFCITHLPQIAALADYQLKVTKMDRNGEVTSLIQQLNNENRIREIARLMGGEELSDTLLQSAKEILDKGQNKD